MLELLDLKNGEMKKEESDSESEAKSHVEEDLPKLQKRERPQLKNYEYLKLYKQKNVIHEADREKASSLVKNMVVPPLKVLRKNPIFNRKVLPELEIKLRAEDLFSMNQLDKNTYNKTLENPVAQKKTIKHSSK